MIKSFNGLRFAFALLICLSHLILPQFGGKALFFDTNAPLTFFFVLSGFVLSFAYHEKMLGKSFSAKGFLFKRLAKLYPTHLLSLAIILLLFAKNYTWNAETWGKLFCQVFLLHAYAPSQEWYFAFNRVSWYLSAMFFLYACFALFFGGIFRAKRPMLLLCALCALWACGMALFAHFYKANDHYVFCVCPLPRLLDFFAGAWLFLLYQKLKSKNFPAAALSAAEVLAVLSFAATYALSGKIHVAEKYRMCFLFLPSVSLIILVFALSDGKGFLAKLLGSRPLCGLGGISFAFYMTHLYCQNLFVMIEPFGWYSNNAACFTAGYLLFTLAFSAIVERFFARRISAWAVKRWNNGRN